MSERTASVQTYTRAVALCFVLSMIGGGFGEMYVPSKLIVTGDAAATANNLLQSRGLFRLGFAAYLVEAVSDVVLAWLLYVLLRPAGKQLALLSAFFGLVSTTLYAVAELFYFVSPIFLGGAKYLEAFSPAQRNALAYLSLRAFAVAGGIFMLFYGIAWLLRAYLMLRSGYFPKALAILLGVGGLGFVVRNGVLVLAPAYATDAVLLPLAAGVIGLALWLGVKGIDMQKWEATCAAQ